MIIRAQMPDGSIAVLDVADNTLVYDGQEFKAPSSLKYVEVYALPVEALTTNYKEVVESIQTYASTKALVINVDPTSVPDSDPLLTTALDPSGGQCVCGLTCTGTDIRFVVVTVETP